jgi:hypothetical protein
MNERKELESYVLEVYSFLQKEFGLSKPKIKRESWNTTISYLAKEIALEIVLDWYDMDVFILVTKLENGKLPGGYYTWKGKLYRVHLGRYLRLLSANGEKQILEFKKIFNKKKKRNRKVLEEGIEGYGQLLRKFIDDIIREGLNVFEKFVEPMDRP